MFRSIIFAAVLPLAAVAGPSEVVHNHILPGYAGFAAATSDLAATAQTTCDPAVLVPAYHAAFDAWMSISHIQPGPIEKDGRGLKIAFWPDPKNQTGKALGRLTSSQDPAVETDAGFAEVSVAAQGLFALERMLFEPPAEGPYTCALTRAITVSLAESGTTLNDEWQDFAQAILIPGNQNNPVYQSEEEVLRALYTTLSTGLEFLQDQRLGRPLGTFDRPRPTRAEARRSGRSLRNVQLNLIALRDLTRQMADFDTPDTEAAFAKAIDQASALTDPVFAGVDTPGGRFRVEVLQQAVQTVRSTIDEEVGLRLGVSAGFNALDGD
jgi:predicted lipoprotein